MVLPWLALPLGGLFLLPAVLAKDPVPFALRLLALYGGLAGALGLLYALHLEWRRTEERGRRWTRFLEALARLGEERQILLFTCHSREARLAEGREGAAVLRLQS